MPKIKDYIDGLAAETLTPEQPAVTPSPTVDTIDVDEAALAELVEKLTKPWQHGNCLSRFAKDAKVSLKVVRRVKKEIDKRIRLEQLKNEGTE